MAGRSSHWGYHHQEPFSLMGFLFCFVFYLLNHQFIVKGYNQKQPDGRGVWGKICGKRLGLPWPSSMTLSPNLHLFTNPEALSSFSLWNSTYPSTANTTEQPSLLLPSRHLCALGSAHWSFYLFSSLFTSASPNITLQVRKSVINFSTDMPIVRGRQSWVLPQAFSNCSFWK